MQEKSYYGLWDGRLHRLTYTEWGDGRNPNVLICVPALNRNGRDFDYLANYLSEDYRVVCPDLVGRGKSDWLDEGQSYSNLHYLHDLVALIARLDVESVDFLGSSMGGILGICLASYPNTPIRRLILNDVGPLLPEKNVERIKQYALKKSFFQTYDKASQFIRRAYKPFGIRDENHWAHFITHSLVLKNDGYTLAFDPRAANAVTWHLNPKGCFQEWDKLRCPILVLHGSESDILTAPILKEMKNRPIPFDYHAFDGCGHTPNLMEQNHIDVIAQWLKQTKNLPGLGKNVSRETFLPF